MLVLAAAMWAGTVQATDVPEPALHVIPDLRLSISEAPGETSVRLPLSTDGHVLYGLLRPYVSLGSSTTLGTPWATSLPPGLRRDTDGLDDVWLGAGMSVPLSERLRIYGEYRFLRGRLDSGAGRGLLQREPDSADFRAGFSIRLD